MTFLAPALLALAAAALVPLILHLLQRHQGPRIVFPALRYLQRAERENATRIRLRQLLLLALRVLAVLLVAAAAARPLLDVGGGGHAPTSVVMVLDDSPSSGAVTGDRRVLDALKAGALAALERAGPEDRFWLIRAGRSWEPAVTGDAAAVAEAVRRTEPGWGRGDLAAELERAESILAAEAEGRAAEIHILTDLQATAWRPVRRRSGGPPIHVFRPAGSPPANRSVTSVEVGGGLPPRVGERSTVTAGVAGPHGDDDDAVTDAGGDDAAEATSPRAAAADSLEVRLVLDGGVRAAGRAAPGTTVALPFPARSAGLVAGRVEIDPDALTADDRRHFAVEVRPAPAVALTDPLPFLAEALAVLEEGGRIRRSPAGVAEVVVAPGAEGADAVRRGAAVVVLPPSSPLELPAVNQRLAGAGIPLRYGAPRGGEARLDAAGTGLEEALADARLRAIYPLERPGDAADSVRLRLRAGGAWAVTGRVPDGGRYVALASPLVPEAGTIPTSAAMLPLLDRIISAWAAGSVEEPGRRPGEVVALPAADTVVGPGGAAEAVSGTVYRLREPGVYRVRRAGTTVAAFAVNPWPGESRLARLDDAALAELLPGRDARVVGGDRWVDAVFHSRTGREATLPVVAALVALLLVESLAAASGRAGRRPSPR